MFRLGTVLGGSGGLSGPIPAEFRCQALRFLARKWFYASVLVAPLGFRVSNSNGGKNEADALGASYVNIIRISVTLLSALITSKLSKMII